MAGRRRVGTGVAAAVGAVVSVLVSVVGTPGAAADGSVVGGSGRPAATYRCNVGDLIMTAATFTWAADPPSSAAPGAAFALDDVQASLTLPASAVTPLIDLLHLGSLDGSVTSLDLAAVGATPAVTNAVGAGSDAFSVPLRTGQPATITVPSSPVTVGHWLPAHTGTVTVAPGAVAFEFSDGSGRMDVTCTPPTPLPAGDAANVVVEATAYWEGGDGAPLFALGSSAWTARPTGFGAAHVVGVVGTPAGGGYWLVGSDGGVFSFGDAAFWGSLPGLGLRVDDIVAMAPSPDGHGYWLVGADGAVYAFGDAAFWGSLPGLDVRVHDIVAVAPAADGRGYRLTGADGGVFAFGDARFQGSLPGMGVRVADVDGMATTPDGGGYWLVGADGGVFALGDATYGGSAGHDGSKAVGIASDGTGGYWVLLADGRAVAGGGAPAASVRAF